MLTEFGRRVNAIEECYEFLLAYAAQGRPGTKDSQQGAQARESLCTAARSMAGLREVGASAIRERQLEPAERYGPFLAVLERDAGDSLAAVEVVLAQPAISSQLIDSLNASIHLRALLTDLFLLGEILNPT